MIGINKYLEKGITITGNPTDGYSVFTIDSQHFNISSLDELTEERFKQAISDLNDRDAIASELFKVYGFDISDEVKIDFIDYLKGAYDKL